MRILVLTNMPSDWAKPRTDALGNTASVDSKIVFVEDPLRLLWLASAERVAIINLLCNEGPMTADDISSDLARARRSILQDLAMLLDHGIVDVDRNANFFFDFDGIRLTLQCPLSVDRGLGCEKGVDCCGQKS